MLPPPVLDVIVVADADPDPDPEPLDDPPVLTACALVLELARVLSPSAVPLLLRLDEELVSPSRLQ